MTFLHVSNFCFCFSKKCQEPTCCLQQIYTCSRFYYWHTIQKSCNFPGMLRNDMKILEQNQGQHTLFVRMVELLSLIALMSGMRAMRKVSIRSLENTALNGWWKLWIVLGPHSSVIHLKLQVNKCCNTKIKIAPSVDKGHILIRISVTVFICTAIQVRSAVLSHILKEWLRRSSRVQPIVPEWHCRLIIIRTTDEDI